MNILYCLFENIHCNQLIFASSFDQRQRSAQPFRRLFSLFIIVLSSRPIRSQNGALFKSIFRSAACSPWTRGLSSIYLSATTKCSVILALTRPRQSAILNSAFIPGTFATNLCNRRLPTRRISPDWIDAISQLVALFDDAGNWPSSLPGKGSIEIKFRYIVVHVPDAFADSRSSTFHQRRRRRKVASRRSISDFVVAIASGRSAAGSESPSDINAHCQPLSVTARNVVSTPCPDPFTDRRLNEVDAANADHCQPTSGFHCSISVQIRRNRRSTQSRSDVVFSSFPEIPTIVVRISRRSDVRCPLSIS